MSQIPSPISLPQLVYKGIPVITTDTLAQAYEVDAVSIRKNFSCNKERFTEGKHYYTLSGNELREFKNCVTESNSVGIGKRTPNLTLWTERGAARHAKMLNSDRAWDMFELLEETFFRVARPASLPDESPSFPGSVSITPSTVEDRKPLRALVNAWAHVSAQPFNVCWTQLKAAFRLTDIRDLPQEWIPDALAWVQAKIDALSTGAVPARTPALPFDELPVDMEAGRKDALRKIRSIMNSMEAARSVVSLFCYPAQRTMDMPRAQRLTYDAQHDFYAAALDCLSAAYAALEAGYMLGRSGRRG